MYSPTESRPSPFQSPATGIPFAGPKLNWMTGASTALAFVTLKVPLLGSYTPTEFLPVAVPVARHRSESGRAKDECQQSLAGGVLIS